MLKYLLQTSFIYNLIKFATTFIVVLLTEAEFDIIITINMRSQWLKLLCFTSIELGIK